MIRFDIHGVIVEIHNETKKLRTYLKNELEYFLSDTTKESDIRLEFVSKYKPSFELNRIGNQAEFGNNKFFALINANRVLIPFHKIGKKINIIGILPTAPGVILERVIEPAVYFKLLTKNLAFTHSSAVFLNDAGIIFPAWTHAGKTELIFELMRNGAEFISDDWTFISDNEEIYAYPRPIWIHSHTFKYFPKMLSQLFPANTSSERKKRLQKSDRSRSYKITVDNAFPNTRIRKKCPLDYIVHLIRYKGKKITIMKQDPDLIIEKILAVNNFARMNYFLPFYALYKYAFPNKMNMIVESAEETERKILKTAFKNKSVFTIKIPLVANPRDICEILLENIF